LILKRFYSLYPDLEKQINSYGENFNMDYMKSYVDLFKKADTFSIIILHSILDIIPNTRKAYHEFYNSNKDHQKLVLPCIMSNYKYYITPTEALFFHACGHLGKSYAIDPIFKGAKCFYYKEKAYTLCETCAANYKGTEVIERDDVFSKLVDMSKLHTLVSMNKTLQALYLNVELTEEQKENIPLLMGLNPFLDILIRLPVYETSVS
jgi:hypothetical protein